MRRASDGGHDVTADPLIRRLEARPEHGLLHPRGAGRQPALRREARHAGARAGAAGRAIPFRTRTQHEVPRIGAGADLLACCTVRRRRRCARTMRIDGELDMVDRCTVVATQARRVVGRTQAHGEARELLQAIHRDRQAMVVADEEPVAPPGNVAVHHAVAGNVDGDPALRDAARHVANTHAPIRVQARDHGTDRGLDQVIARSKPTERRQRADHADRAMTAHAQRADVVEEDDAERRTRRGRRQHHRTHEPCIAAGFMHHRAHQRCPRAIECSTHLGWRSGQARDAVHERARRLSLGVAVDAAQTHRRIGGRHHGDGS